MVAAAAGMAACWFPNPHTPPPWRPEGGAPQIRGAAAGEHRRLPASYHVDRIGFQMLRAWDETPARAAQHCALLEETAARGGGRRWRRRRRGPSREGARTCPSRSSSRAPYCSIGVAGDGDVIRVLSVAS
jgi:hypothetical protein